MLTVVWMVRVVGMRVVHPVIGGDVLIRMLARQRVGRVGVRGELSRRWARSRAD